MMPEIPAYITAIVVAIDLVIIGSVWTILSSAARRSGLPAAAQTRVRIGSAVFLAAWFAGVLLFAPTPAALAARDPFYLTPAIPAFATVPLLLVGLALWGSPALRRVLASVPVPALIGVQAYRVIGAVFLVLLAQGKLPAHFALPAGWGDVGIGLAAPLVALALARRVPGARTLAVAWVVVGLLDLAVAVGMGTGFLAPLLAPGLGSRVPPAAPMGALPMILVPGFAVPISVALHLAALVRLLGRAWPAPDAAAGALATR